MVGILIAILSGALMSVQGVFNEGVTKQTSVWVSAGFVQLTAFLFCVIAWFATGKNGSPASLFSVDKKYMLLGGVLGALITYTVIRSMSALGPAQAVMLIVTAQLSVAYLIELFGLFGIQKSSLQWQKLLGLTVTILGIVIFQCKKK